MYLCLNCLGPSKGGDFSLSSQTNNWFSESHYRNLRKEVCFVVLQTVIMSLMGFSLVMVWAKNKKIKAQ